MRARANGADFVESFNLNLKARGSARHGPPRRVKLVNLVNLGPPKGKRHFWGIWVPALSRWANFCPAYGVCVRNNLARLKAAATKSRAVAPATLPRSGVRGERSRDCCEPRPVGMRPRS